MSYFSRSNVLPTEEFDSGNQDTNENVTLTLAHLLGRSPRLIRVTLVNVSNDLGYVPGDEIDITNNINIHVYSDATNIYVVTANVLATVLIQVINKSTRALGFITKANWKIRVRAW